MMRMNCIIAVLFVAGPPRGDSARMTTEGDDVGGDNFNAKEKSDVTIASASMDPLKSLKESWGGTSGRRSTSGEGAGGKGRKTQNTADPKKQQGSSKQEQQQNPNSKPTQQQNPNSKPTQQQGNSEQQPQQQSNKQQQKKQNQEEQQTSGGQNGGSGGAATGTEGSDEKASSGNHVDPDKVTKWHNGLKCLHGFPALKWDKKLEDHVLKWAKDQGNKLEHSGMGDDYRRNKFGYEFIGECISGGKATNQEGIRNWYDEIEATGGGKGICKDDEAGSGPGGLTGHYCTTIWKSSTHLGCARAGKDWPLYCMYGPGKGYEPAAYEANTGPVVKKESECKNVPTTKWG